MLDNFWVTNYRESKKPERIRSRSRTAEPGRTGAPRSSQPGKLPRLPCPRHHLWPSSGKALAALWRRGALLRAGSGRPGFGALFWLLRLGGWPDGGGTRRRCAAAACGGSSGGLLRRGWWGLSGGGPRWCWRWRPAWLHRAARRAGLEVLLPWCSAPASMVLAELPSPTWFSSTWCGGASSGR